MTTTILIIVTVDNGDDDDDNGAAWRSRARRPLPLWPKTSRALSQNSCIDDDGDGHGGGDDGGVGRDCRPVNCA